MNSLERKIVNILQEYCDLFAIWPSNHLEDDLDINVEFRNCICVDLENVFNIVIFKGEMNSWIFVQDIIDTVRVLCEKN
jgi:hypothetical protein